MHAKPDKNQSSFVARLVTGGGKMSWSSPPLFFVRKLLFFSGPDVLSPYLPCGKYHFPLSTFCVSRIDSKPRGRRIRRRNIRGKKKKGSQQKRQKCRENKMAERGDVKTQHQPPQDYTPPPYFPSLPRPFHTSPCLSRVHSSGSEAAPYSFRSSRSSRWLVHSQQQALSSAPRAQEHASSCAVC